MKNQHRYMLIKEHSIPQIPKTLTPENSFECFLFSSLMGFHIDLAMVLLPSTAIYTDGMRLDWKAAC